MESRPGIEYTCWGQKVGNKNCCRKLRSLKTSHCQKCCREKQIFSKTLTKNGAQSVGTKKAHFSNWSQMKNSLGNKRFDRMF